MSDNTNNTNNTNEYKKDTQSRKWFITINNPEPKGWTHENIKNAFGKLKGVVYWCLCDEVGGKQKTYHTHIFVYKKSAMRFSRLKKIFTDANIKSAMGSCQECRDYIRKEGKYLNTNKADTNLKETFEEYGMLPDEQQGRRNDLNNLYDMIKDGMTDYEILEEDAEFMTRLDTIGKVRETIRYEEFSKILRDLKVEYWYGKSGTGKTSGVLNQYGFENVYVVDDPRHPWDSYHGEDVVLFDEFDASSYQINQILRWLDRYPVSLPCRYNNKQACFTKVYLTSNQPIEEQYFHLARENKETFNALLRRFTSFKVFGQNGCIQEYSDYDTYYERWRKALAEEVPFKKKEENKQMDLSECELFANAQEENKKSKRNKGN